MMTAMTMTQATLGLEWTNKRTRKREFLDEMQRVVPWAQLVAMIERHSPRAKTGRPPFPVETMLRIHFLQNWFTLGDQAMEEALIDIPLYREFAQLNTGADRLPAARTAATARRPRRSRLTRCARLAACDAAKGIRG